MNGIINHMKYKTVFKVFFVWQEKKEGQWLRKMSNDGWHLDRVGFLHYRFKKGEPKDTIYQFDFKLVRRKELGDYITIFEDAGWEYVSRCGNWYYFRTEAKEGLIPEIYTDNASKLKKYKLLLVLLTVIAIPQIYFFVMMLTRFKNVPPYSLPVTLLYALILCSLIYAIVRISLIIKRIKQDIRE